MSSIIAPTGAVPGQPLTPEPVAPAAAPDLPEKYLGKSITDVIEMHRNSESRLGQLQNEVGQLRGLVSDLAQVQRGPAPQVADKSIDVTGDDLISDPIGTVRKIYQHDLAAEKAKLAEAQAKDELRRETERLQSDFDVVALTSQPEFQLFANRTIGRQMDLQVAINGQGIDQVRAARRLLEDFVDFSRTSPSPAQETQSAIERARAVSNPSPTSSAVTLPQEVVYESDVLKLIQSDPEKYRSPTFQRELAKAIRENRYVKR
jgi:hypothetical protein